MANNVTALVSAVWSRRTQEWKKKFLVGKEIASYEERANLVEGDTVHRSRYSDLVVQDYVRNTDNSPQDITSSDETLVVNRSKHVSFIVDRLDEVQSKYNFKEDRAKNAGYQLANEMDQTILDEVKSATFSSDDGDTGGTPGNPVAVTAANSFNVMSTLKALMRGQNIEEYDGYFAVVTPLLASKFEQAFTNSGFNTADATLKNGYAGPFGGLNIYVSNNIRHTVKLTTTGNAVANETVTINGVVFTWKASAVAAGEVAVGGSAAASIQNLIDAINLTGTAGSSTYIAVSTANRNLLKNVRATATLSGTADMILATAGKTTFTETMTNATLGTVTANIMAGRKGVVDVVDQISPTTQINKLQYQTGYNVLTYCLYGVKTFTEGADRMYNLKIVG